MWAACAAAWLGGGRIEHFPLPVLIADAAATRSSFRVTEGHVIVALSEFVVAAVCLFAGVLERWLTGDAPVRRLDRTAGGLPTG